VDFLGQLSEQGRKILQGPPHKGFDDLQFVEGFMECSVVIGKTCGSKSEIQDGATKVIN